MSDLQKLIEAVEAGGGLRIPYLDELALDTIGRPGSDRVGPAFNGSLDAAKALHEALLPDHTWNVSTYHEQDAMASVYFKSHLPMFRAFNHNPARAWLLAILKAYEAQQ